jgi:hypothetical protein
MLIHLPSYRDMYIYKHSSTLIARKKVWRYIAIDLLYFLVWIGEYRNMKRLYIGAAILKMIRWWRDFHHCFHVATIPGSCIHHCSTTKTSWFQSTIEINAKRSQPRRWECSEPFRPRVVGGSVARISEARFYEKCPRPLGKRTINTWISREQCKILFDPSRRITNHVVGRIRRPLSAMI